MDPDLKFVHPAAGLPACDIEQELPLVENVPVIIAHVETPNDFYVIKRDDLLKRDYIKDSLGSVMAFGGLEIFRSKYSKSKVAAMKFSAHDCKRVRILEKLPERKRLVQFIDYGDTGVYNAGDLKVIPTNFRSIPPLAIHCSLHVVPRKNKTWSDDVINTLRDDLDMENAPSDQKLDGGGLFAQCVAKEDGVNIVKLKPRFGTDWGEMLVEAGMACRMGEEIDDIDVSDSEQEDTQEELYDPVPFKIQKSHEELNILDDEEGNLADSEDIKNSSFRSTISDPPSDISDIAQESFLSHSIPNSEANQTQDLNESLKTLNMSEQGGDDDASGFLDRTSSSGLSDTFERMNVSPWCEKHVRRPTTSKPAPSPEVPGVECKIPEIQQREPKVLYNASSIPYEFTYAKLPKRKPLSDSQSSDKFSVCAGFHFNQFYIVNETNMKNEFIQLMDEINSYILTDSGPVKLEHLPRVSDVVLVKSMKKKSPEYIRAVVQRVLRFSRFELKNIDNGEVFIVEKHNLYSLSEELMEILPLGYEVILEGVILSPPLIDLTRFEILMDKIRTKSYQIVQTEEWRNSNGLPYISLKEVGTNETLADQINKLRAWPWEEVLNHGICHTDEEIISRIEPMKEVPLLQLLKKDDLNIQVKRVAFVEEFKVGPIITFEVLGQETEERRNVLRSQTARFVEKVRATDIYPAGGELIFILPPDGETGAGEWHRAIRVSPLTGMYYGIDNGITYKTDSKEGFKLRKMTPDFVCFPHLVVDGTLDNFVDSNLSRDIVHEIFQVGKELRVSLENIRDAVFICRSLEYEEELKKRRNQGQ